MSTINTSSPHWSKDAIALLKRLAADDPDLESHYTVTIANLRGMSALEKKLEQVMDVVERHIISTDKLAHAIRTASGGAGGALGSGGSGTPSRAAQTAKKNRAVKTPVSGSKTQIGPPATNATSP
jgi:hypothetical protein